MDNNVLSLIQRAQLMMLSTLLIVLQARGKTAKHFVIFTNLIETLYQHHCLGLATMVVISISTTNTAKKNDPWIEVS